jgi:hypothetical protein
MGKPMSNRSRPTGGRLATGTVIKFADTGSLCAKGIASYPITITTSPQRDTLAMSSPTPWWHLLGVLVQAV